MLDKESTYKDDDSFLDEMILSGISNEKFERLKKEEPQIQKLFTFLSSASSHNNEDSTLLLDQSDDFDYNNYILMVLHGILSYQEQNPLEKSSILLQKFVTKLLNSNEPNKQILVYLTAIFTENFGIADFSLTDLCLISRFVFSPVYSKILITDQTKLQRVRLSLLKQLINKKMNIWFVLYFIFKYFKTYLLTDSTFVQILGMIPLSYQLLFMILMECLINKDTIDENPERKKFYNNYLILLMINIEKFLCIGGAELYIKYFKFISAEIQIYEDCKQNPYFIMYYQRNNNCVRTIEEEKENYKNKARNNQSGGGFDVMGNDSSNLNRNNNEGLGASVTKNLFGFMNKIVKQVNDLTNDKETPYLNPSSGNINNNPNIVQGYAPQQRLDEKNKFIKLQTPSSPSKDFPRNNNNEPNPTQTTQPPPPPPPPPIHRHAPPLRTNPGPPQRQH